MRKFNLEEAKAGKPVCTRDGSDVRLLCFDKKNGFPIVGLITDAEGYESISAWHIDGSYIREKEGDLDLFMKTEKKEYWVNVYMDKDKARCHVGDTYPSRESAEVCVGENEMHVVTVKIYEEEV